MQTKPLRPVCGVILCPLGSVMRMAFSFGCHLVTTSYNCVPLPFTPGSFAVSDVCKSGGWEKKHTFTAPDTLGIWSDLITLTREPFILTYHDVRGVERVSGTLSHPLTLNVERAAGYIKGTITGTCSEPDTERVYTATIED